MMEIWKYIFQDGITIQVPNYIYKGLFEDTYAKRVINNSNEFMGKHAYYWGVRVFEAEL